ncbi:cox cluster protein [Halorhabdus tiamatea SARL4B]|uniref:Cox cluster protein n=1 Tax=Halorhabdus tiamatea SARL4B TaxID=1033806 RepID=F7PIK3_9EURY|nr:hypothetical protein [Halorhabdus tiamatea]ERJ04598.1 cox cluster protein [Halorhabdus tiamatea SARL4B]CCQ32155.1 cox cluster protein [Halorhabdus tiamatea SARL4B]
MSEQTNVQTPSRRASPWPLFVALGFALSELGVFIGLYPVAVGGILLLGASVAGILRESRYASNLWRPIAGLGVVFVVLGGIVVATQIDPGTVEVASLLTEPNGIVGRGLSITGAGVILLAVGIVGLVSE